MSRTTSASLHRMLAITGLTAALAGLALPSGASALSIDINGTTQPYNGVTLGAAAGDDDTLVVRQGGVLDNTLGGFSHAFVGRAAGSIGTAAVTGAGSSWTNTGDLLVGYGGQGSVLVEQGATLRNRGASLGQDSPAVGVVTVTGSGSKWITDDTINLGTYSGTGIVNAQDQALIQSQSAYIGAQTQGKGAFNIDGQGTVWNNVRELYVGNAGQGELNITNGAVVNSVGTQYSASTLYAGVVGGQAKGVIRIDGAGSHLNLTGRAALGNSYGGQGELHLTNQGKLTATQGLTIEQGGLLLADDGTLVGDVTSRGRMEVIDLTLDGNLTLTSSSVIDGYVNDDFFSQLIVTGDATLAGLVRLDLAGLAPSFSAQSFDLFQIHGNLLANDLSFEVLNIDLDRVGYELVQGLDGQQIVRLTVSAVPEPATSAMGLMALAALAWQSRRRRIA